MSAPTPIPVPKGFQRLGAFPLDPTSVFTTFTDFQNHAAGGTSYAGQICAVVSGSTTSIYRIEVDKSFTELVASGELESESQARTAADAALQTQIDAKQPTGSYATLVGGKVPSDQLPSYVDDVLEFDDRPSFPIPGESGKIYVTRTTPPKAYRWGTTTYIEISPSEVTSVNGKSGAVSLTPDDIGSSPKLNFLTISPPSTGTWIEPLANNTHYTILNFQNRNGELQLPTLAANGDRVVIRVTQSNSSQISVVRLGGQPFVQQIGLIRGSGVFIALWVGQWISENPAPAGFTSVPSTPSSPGQNGDFAYSDPYLYICISNNNWRRVPVAAW